MLEIKSKIWIYLCVYFMKKNKENKHYVTKYLSYCNLTRFMSIAEQAHKQSPDKIIELIKEIAVINVNVMVRSGS